jgi:hypothetical protein
MEHYFHRIKHFLRWLWNTEINESDGMIPMEEWNTIKKIQEIRDMLQDSVLFAKLKKSIQ